MNKFLRLLTAFISLAWAGVQPCLAELTEGQIKAAYVLNFIKFVEWPAGVIRDDGKVTLCVVGSGSFDDALDTLDGRKAGGREIHILRNAKYDGNQSGCHVLFIAESERRRFTAIIKALGDAPVLTISDIENFAERGGIIGLLYQENKIQFEVNFASMQAGKLHLPGQVLNLAANVFGR